MSEVSTRPSGIVPVVNRFRRWSPESVALFEHNAKSRAQFEDGDVSFLFCIHFQDGHVGACLAREAKNIAICVPGACTCTWPKPGGAVCPLLAVGSRGRKRLSPVSRSHLPREIKACSKVGRWCFTADDIFEHMEDTVHAENSAHV